MNFQTVSNINKIVMWKIIFHLKYCLIKAKNSLEKHVKYLCIIKYMIILIKI
jgi:hypothetical protein